MRILESGFLTTGLILLAIFFLARGWGDYQSKSDIRAFEQAMASEAVPAKLMADGESEQPRGAGLFTLVEQTNR